MFDFRQIVLALVVLALAIPMVSAQETLENQPFNCRTTSTPPLVRLEGVAELAGDILIVCSGIVPNQGSESITIPPPAGSPPGTEPTTVTRLRDLRANITINVDVPVTSRALGVESAAQQRITTESLLINSGNQGRCGATQGLLGGPFCVGPDAPAGSPAAPAGVTTGAIGQGAPYVGGAPVFAHLYPVHPDPANPDSVLLGDPLNGLSVRNHGQFPRNVGGGLSTFGTLEWDNVLLAPGSAAGRIWYMQMKITNVRVNASTLAGQGEFAPAISAIVTLNTTTGTVPLTPDTVVIARPRPSFRVESTRVTRRNCDTPRTVTQNLDIIELLPNAFKPRLDDETTQALCADNSDQCNPNTAYFTESGLMLNDAWSQTGLATQGTQFQIQVVSPPSLDAAPYVVSVGAGADPDPSPASAPRMISAVVAGNPSMTGANAPSSTTLDDGSIARNFRIEVTDFRLSADPFVLNRLRVPITATYNETLFGATTFRVWYVPLADFAAGDGIVKQQVGTGDTARPAPGAPRFAHVPQTVNGYAIVRCRTLLLFPYITNRNGYNTGIAISNTSVDNGAGPYDENPPTSASQIARGANPQTGPCVLYLYGGNNGPANPVAQTPINSTINVPAGGMYLMTLQTGGKVKGPAGQDVGDIGAAPGFEGYAIASCQFQYAHGYAFISDVAVQRVAQGYLALIIPDRTYARPEGANPNWSERPASPFNLGDGALWGGEQLVH